MSALWPELDIPCTVLPGVGPARQRELAAAGLGTVERLLRHLPFRYEDRSVLTQLAEVRGPGQYTIVAHVQRAESRRAGRRHLLRVTLAEGERTVAAVWFNQPYLARLIQPGARVLVSGPVVLDRSGRPVFRAPAVSAAGHAVKAPGWIPVYRRPGQLPRHVLRRAAEEAAARYADQIPDPLPPVPGVQPPSGLLPAPAAWRQLHLPQSAAHLEAARRTVVLHELLALHLALSLRRAARRPPVVRLRSGGPLLMASFLERLPFSLTAAQRRAIAEIARDLAAPRPMCRLLQGDVGAGKTVVAAAAALRVVGAGGQVALMVPSTVLAEQHHRTLCQLSDGVVDVELLTAATPAAERRGLYARLAAGKPVIVIGTQALVDPELRFGRLALAIIDEQHRFGVRQRDQLAAKGQAVDILVMTATPIPRTLLQTFYGDLDVSVLDELPPGRRPVRTFVRAPSSRERVYDFLRAEVRAGRQAFVVCPLIGGADGDGACWDDPEALAGGGGRASAEAWAARLARLVPADTIGLLHGGLPAVERARVMARFAAGELAVLVATTVVEVGVDVPNATVMVVEDADRFGLAQLHQLRGRVGRGTHGGTCILITETGRKRIEAMTHLADGFAVAEADLVQRGPGEVLGTRQHGLPGLDLARMDRDLDLWRVAPRLAAGVLAHDPELRLPAHATLRRMAAQWAEVPADHTVLSGFMPPE